MSSMNQPTQFAWTRKGLLISRSLFTKYNHESQKLTIILTLVFTDKNGTQFEVSSFNQANKIFYINRIVREGSFYEIKGVRGFSKTNNEFSTSEEYTGCRRWWIEQVDAFPLKGYIDCSASLSDAIDKRLKNRKPINVLGSFCQLIRGPAVFAKRKKPIVQGWFVVLTDRHNVKYQVLIWVHSRDKSTPQVFNCQRNDPVLVVAARPSYVPKDAPENQKNYTLTTLFTPVADSTCFGANNLIKLAFHDKSR